MLKELIGYGYYKIREDEKDKDLDKKRWTIKISNKSQWLVLDQVNSLRYYYIFFYQENIFWI